MVMEGSVEPHMCRVCDSVMLHYYAQDKVFFKCLGCDRKVYPGTHIFDQMDAAYSNWMDTGSSQTGMIL